MRYPLYFFLLLLVTPLFGQSAELSPKTIQAEKDYIEAKRDALLGKTEQALDRFQELAENDPDNDALHFELGRLQYAAGQTDAAIAATSKAFELRPADAYATFLAELYQRSGRYREGAELYARLRKKQPATESFYLEQAAFLVRAQEVDAAIAVYDDLEKRIGVNAELTRRKHALYLGKGDLKRAENELLNLVKSVPEQLEYRHLLAGFYTSQGEEGKARKMYQAILQQQPADVRAQLALQDVTATNKPADSDEVLALLARTDMDIDLKIGKVLPLVQQIIQQKGKSEKTDPAITRALALAAELRRVHPDEAKAAAIQGDIYFHTGQYAEAAAAYQATIELDDTVYPVWEQLLATLYLDNQIVTLRKYAEEALDIFPNRPAVYVQYALGEALRADFDEALSLLEQAAIMVRKQPEASASLQQLKRALEGLASGNPPSALRLDQLPGGTEGPLAFLLQKRSNPQALKAYDTPENTNALFLEALGDAWQTEGNKAAAQQAYARAKAAGSKASSLRKKLATP